MSQRRASRSACEVVAATLVVASVAAGATVSVTLPVLSRFTPPHSSGIDTASARPGPAPSDAHAPFQGQCSSSLTTRYGGAPAAAESSQAPRSTRPVSSPHNPPACGWPVVGGCGPASGARGSRPQFREARVKGVPHVPRRLDGLLSSRGSAFLADDPDLVRIRSDDSGVDPCRARQAQCAPRSRSDILRTGRYPEDSR